MRPWMRRPWSTDRFVEDGLKEMAVFGLNDIKLRLEAVAHGHEFVSLGDGAALFGEGRHHNRKSGSTAP